MSGQSANDSIIAVPRQRDTDKEKRALKEGRTPGEWAPNRKRLAQNYQDAR
jgi:hypothetical protein